MARLLAGMLQCTRRPGLWLALLLIAAIFVMPEAEPLMRALFPGDPRPVYARARLKVLLADRGFEADAVRADMEQRGGVPIIATKKNRLA